MNNTIYYDSAFSDDERRRRLYDGQLLVFSPRKSILNFVNFARSIIQDAFGDLDPAEDCDRSQQRLAQPDVGRRGELVVAGERPAGGRDRRKQDADPEESEHRLSDHAGKDRQPVGAVAPELCHSEQPVGTVTAVIWSEILRFC